MCEELMERVVSQENATAAWKAVKANRGAPGIDGMTTTELRDHIRKHWESIRAKLVTGTCVPTPVRRKEILKPDGGIRLLGIPTVLDRWIQQMLLQELQPIFEAGFSPNSYGFRPKRSAHDAVRAAQNYIRGGKDWVVDMDITQFFDPVNHDILMARVGRRIRDKRVLKSITTWIEENLRLKVNATKSGVGRPWERKFLGFRVNPEGKIEAAPKSLERFKDRVREMWQSCQSLTRVELRDRWRACVRGWWGYYRLAEDRRSIFRLEGWIRRPIRCCFWQRWHKWRGRLRHWRQLGLKGDSLRVAHSSKGAWRIAATRSLQTALSNAVLRRYGFLMPSDLVASV